MAIEIHDGADMTSDVLSWFLEQLNNTEHEKLPDLLGGGDGGHFHLEEPELEKLHTLIKLLLHHCI